MKMRLDQALVERGLAQDIAHARALIMAGQVSGDGRLLDKPGFSVLTDASLHVKVQPRYVSRAGDKLASVAGHLGLQFDGQVVLDVGSSTGGFTDYALQHGATRVYCVDVGTAQLAYRLRQDKRVVVMERTDIRDVQLPEQPTIAVVDVSFISLTKVLDPTANLLVAGSLIAAMAKPQFEATREVADRWHGVIPEGADRDKIIMDLRRWLAGRFLILNEADSGVAGSEGNIERFFLLTN